MEHLHSYWRMAYIKAPDRIDGGNPFARMLEREDKDALIVYRGKLNFIVMNRFPYNAGHLLVLPNREVPELSELSAEERVEHFELTIKAQDILKKALQPNGFNVGYNFGSAAGAGIPSHLHCHIVPRWEGDNNFMPVLGDTRVLPEALKTMWERLRKFC